MKLGVGSLEDLADESVRMHDGYLERLEENKMLSGQAAEQIQNGDGGELTEAREAVFSKWVA